MLGILYTGGFTQLHPALVKVEVDIANGLPGWSMVGLPEKGVQESRERVNAAIRNSGIKLEVRKTVINLAPATQKKSGSQYDLPIAVGLLAAHKVIEKGRLLPFLFCGELSLNGELKPIPGALLFAMLAKQKKFKGLILPKANSKEAKLIKGIEVIGCETLTEVYQFLAEGIFPPPEGPAKGILQPKKPKKDLSDVKGQFLAKRALEIAAAGYHHCLFIGTPGSGKSMLASRFPTLLPPLTEKESLETTKIYSSLGLLDAQDPLMTGPPFREPHHSISYSALVGGGNGFLNPGEITLAHNGVLFLDELPEFRRDALQMLRQPLETGIVTITRTRARMRLPARFQLLAAMNPCKCGWLGHPKRPCTCDPGRIYHYRNKISGPLLDRIDLQVEVPPVTSNDLFELTTAESSEKVKARILTAREKQKYRFKNEYYIYNSDVPGSHLKFYCKLSDSALKLFKQFFLKLHLSARAHDRILKISRTIADLQGEEKIRECDIAEALQYRTFDRDGLG